MSLRNRPGTAALSLPIANHRSMSFSVRSLGRMIRFPALGSLPIGRWQVAGGKLDYDIVAVAKDHDNLMPTFIVIHSDDVCMVILKGQKVSAHSILEPHCVQVAVMD